MTAITDKFDETIEKLSTEQTDYPAPKIVAENAFLKDAKAEYEFWKANPDEFWERQAEKFVWKQKWNKVSNFDGVYHQWFIGGQTNITLNALDRHVNSDRRNVAAFIWLGEDGTERIITYDQLLRSVNRFANGLKSLGVKKGDRVVIYMPLTIEGVISMLACARIGAIHSVVYAGLGHAALRDRIVDAQAKVVITGDVGFRRGKAVPLKTITDEAVAELEFVEKIVVFSRRLPKIEFVSSREIDFDDLMNFSDKCEAEVMDSEDELFILYTSGTTGKPKGVVHVHGGFMVGTTYHLRTFFDVNQSDVFLCTSDIGWIVGHSYIVYAPLCEGVTTVFREGAVDFPHQGIVWEIVEKYGVTKMFTAPTAIRFFMRFGEELPKKYDISSLRVIACAGEPLNPEAWRWAQTHLCGDGKHGYCVDNWWQTELGGPTIGTPITMPMRTGKAGIPLAGVVADVVDAEGTSVPPNVGGRLVLRNPFPMMMRTVWGDNARYERMWKQIEGCYVSGDVAIKDEDGYIQVLGRADDVMNVAGHRIGTADVESALVSHPSVAEAAVIGIPDEIKGESIVGFVQLRSGHSETESLKASLVEHVRRELGPIATPSKIEIMKALPKTRSGKIMRRYLKALEMGTDAGDLSTLEE
ncbi:MAG: acetate--CoA ligase [Pyrinomonadaceae bacterium]|nr:acetate--CoA ligase [Pyrinomonadaceae bacterium]